MNTQRSNRLVACVLTALLASASGTGCDSKPSKKDTDKSSPTPAAGAPGDAAGESSDATRDATAAAKREPQATPADVGKTSGSSPMPRPQPTAAVAGVPQIDMSKLSPTTRAFIAKLQQKTQDAPGSAGRIAELGKYYYANGFPPAAAKCFERAAEILPNAMQFKYLAGLCYDTAGDSASAVQAYEAALALADDYPALHILVADRCLDDDRDRAEALYRRASVLDAKDALAHYGLGRCAVLNGDLEAAVSGFWPRCGDRPDVLRQHMGPWRRRCASWAASVRLPITTIRRRPAHRRR